MDETALDTDVLLCRVGDPYLAAYLFCVGYPLRSLERLGENRSKFHFDEPAKDASNQYYNDEEVKLSSLWLFTSFKVVRSISTHIDALADGKLGVRDIYFAAYLHYRGYKVLTVEPMKFQSRFIFSDIPEQLILDFYNGKLGDVAARKLFESFRAMRNFSSRLHVT